MPKGFNAVNELSAYKKSGIPQDKAEAREYLLKVLKSCDYSSKQTAKALGFGERMLRYCLTYAGIHSQEVADLKDQLHRDFRLPIPYPFDSDNKEEPCFKIKQTSWKERATYFNRSRK